MGDSFGGKGWGDLTRLRLLYNLGEQWHVSFLYVNLIAVTV